MNSFISFFSFSILLLLVGAKNTNSGSLSALNAYWNEIFPSIPMPDAIRALLPSSTEISVAAELRRSYSKVDRMAGSPDRFRLIKRRPWSNRWGALGHGRNTSDRRNWSPELAPLYFLRDDVLPGSKMKVTMMIRPVADHASSGEPAFLPRQQAQKIPFKTSNFTTILEMFSIEPDSKHASFTRQTLVDCEMPALEREIKYCATSLESMIDFVVTEFRTREIHVAITSVVNKEEEVKMRTYRVGAGGGKLMSRKVVACHNMMFPYAVFYCHNFGGTRAYMVPLVADDGSRVNAIALCHFDTSNWNPGHASFRLLGVKPGTVPICHFIVKDLAWLPN